MGLSPQNSAWVKIRHDKTVLNRKGTTVVHRQKAKSKQAVIQVFKPVQPKIKLQAARADLDSSKVSKVTSASLRSQNNYTVVSFR